VKYTVEHVETYRSIGENWTVRINGELVRMFWQESDAYQYVAKRVDERRSFFVNNYEVDT
jgi:hypothetical protein